MAKSKLPVSIDKLLSAWEQLAPDAIFSEMTREQFLAASLPSNTVRTRISDIDRERKASLATRKTSDATSSVLYQRVVNSIKGSPAHGEDSALYRAIGYKTKSERSSGLTRKAQASPENPVVP
ncbi:MAG: hypothetical protein ABIT76_00685 [Chthoniobacterales bacterium]